MTYTLIPLVITALALLGPDRDQPARDRAVAAAEAIDRVINERRFEIDPTCEIEPSCAPAAAYVRPALYPGPLGRLRTGMLMVSIAKHESDYRHDVVSADGLDFGLGQCRRGRAWGSYTAKDILGSADVGAIVEYNALKISRDACGAEASTHTFLGIYAAGHCNWASTVARELCSPVWGCEW